MSLLIRRGTDAQRRATTFQEGELICTTDTNGQKLYIGTGAAGGVNVGKYLAGAGLYWNETTQALDISGSNLTSDTISEGVTNLFFTTERAQDAVASLFTHTDGMSGITFTYDDVNNKMNVVVTGGGTSLPSNSNGVLKNNGGGTLTWSTATVSIDTAPSLGGNLDLNSHNITGNGDITINGTVSASHLSTGEIHKIGRAHV